MFKCDSRQLCLSPCKTQPSSAGREFPHISCSVGQPKEMRVVKTPRYFSVSPWQLLVKDTPAALMLCKHFQTPDHVSGVRFKQFLIQKDSITLKTTRSLWLLGFMFLWA